MLKEMDKYTSPVMPFANGGLVTPEPSSITEHPNARKRKRSGEATVYSLVKDPLSLIELDNSCRIQVKRFAKQGGPDLQDVRGHHCRTMASRGAKESNTPSEPTTRRDSQRSDSQGPESLTESNPKSRGTSAQSKKLSPRSRAFAAHVEKYGIYHADKDCSPYNAAYIQQKLQKSRPELTAEEFTMEDFEAFKRTNATILTEADAIYKVFRIIMGDTKMPSVLEREFNNLNPLAKGTLTKPRVDYYQGSKETDIKSDVRDRLSTSIMPHTDQKGPCLPNFFVEAKSSFGAEEVAINQLLFHGTLGARGMLKMREYVYQDNAIDNNAYTIGFTYKAAARAPSLLSAYTIHPVKSDDPKRDVDYFLVLIDYWPLTKDLASFLEAVKCIRNASELTADYRRKFINEANQKHSEQALPAYRSATVPNESQLAVEPEAQPAHHTKDDTLQSQGNDKVTALGDSQSTDSAGEFASCTGGDIEEIDDIESSFGRPTTPPRAIAARRPRESPPSDEPSQKKEKHS